jgi:hypothetical protein
LPALLVAFTLLAQLLHILLDLCALLRRQYVQKLLTKLLVRLPPGLPVHLSALRLRLTELLHDLAHLRFLLIAQRDAFEHAHEAAAAMAVTLPLPLASRPEGAGRRRLPGLLCKNCHGRRDGGAQRDGEKKRT